MALRAAVAALLAGALLLGTSACTGADPARTPTATEEEAYDAAEENYRAYIDALNAVDLSDPNTFEPLYRVTTGALNASDRKNFSQWHADGYQIIGDGTVSAVTPESLSVDESQWSVVLAVCYDVSDVAVLDRNGASLVAASRPDRQPLTVTLVSDGASNAFQVAKIDPDDESLC